LVEHIMNAPTDSSGSFTGRLFSARNLRRGLLGLGIVVTAVALFYTEENWRGERAWKQCKQAAAARGMVAEWNALIPPAVPDDENFFAAPNMQQWFTGRGSNDFSRRISSDRLDEWMLQRGLVPAADLTVVSANASVAPGDAELVLQYNPPLLTLANPAPASRATPASNMRQNHLEISSAAIKQMFDVIKPKLDALNQTRFSPLVHDVNQRPIGLDPLPTITPLRIIVRTDSHPSADEIKEFLPANLVETTPAGSGLIFTGSNVLRARLTSSLPYTPATDFLAWSDGFQDEFDALDAALERPYARMGGDYEHPATIPIPNFVCARATAQLLALRTQCHLLLGEPDKALRDLTLLHHLARMFEGRPTSKPMTLIAAMINGAVKGLYVMTVGDGLRLHVWQEPQLAEIQRQLGETDLLPYLHESLELESLVFGWDVEGSSSGEIADLFYTGRNVSFWQKMKDPVYVYCRFAPHGWLYQNAVAGSRLNQNTAEGFDLTNQTLRPGKLDANWREVERQIRHKAPYTYLANMFVPNFSRAMQTTAKNQTLVNEAYVVCGLERYRLAHGNYPDTLDALVPQFADKLPRDLFGGGDLKYRNEGGKFVLYSVGWNETDEGGVPSWKNDTSGDLTKNDWVWPYQEISGK
jgi:hypothetical protein